MDFKGSRRTNALRWTLAIAALGMLVAPADAALCVKRSGAIIARAQCKQKEAVLSPDAFSGAPGPAGAAGAAGAKGDKGDKGDPAGFRVIDSTGREIGVVDAYSYMTVIVPSAGILSFVVGPEGFDPCSSGPYLYHEGSNCTGAAFVGRYAGDGFVQYPDVLAATAYYAGNPVAEHTFNSYEHAAPTCATAYTPRGLCCENYQSPYTRYAGPVQTFDLRASARRRSAW